MYGEDKTPLFSGITKGPRTSRAEPAHRHDVSDTHMHKLTTRDSGSFSDTHCLTVLRNARL